MSQDIDICELARLSRIKLSPSEAAHIHERLLGLLKLIENLNNMDS
ncbi:MAG: hypothetical protein LBH25_06985 [Fibromonadaceae bacterium]|jgi:Asp-tRNA(Asn)/Glu-tRNA(Gln) amidotransferase C subunit|nr:hypothetical protein [Fibromonadaceae bacterium]